MSKLIEELTQEQLRSDIPSFRPGDTVRVHAKVVEGTRERIQIFEGVVIKRRGAGISETYTVRKVSNGVGVERTFPLHTPRVAQIEVVRYGKVRKSDIHLSALHILYSCRRIQRSKLYLHAEILRDSFCIDDVIAFIFPFLVHIAKGGFIREHTDPNHTGLLDFLHCPENRLCVFSLLLYFTFSLLLRLRFRSLSCSFHLLLSAAGCEYRPR